MDTGAYLRPGAIRRLITPSLLGRDCFAGLDLPLPRILQLGAGLSSETEEEKHCSAFLLAAGGNTEPAAAVDHVLYDVWERQGYILTTEGKRDPLRALLNGSLSSWERSTIIEIAYDRWNATQMVQNLEDMGFYDGSLRQGFKEMSPPSKELYKLLMEGNIIHGGNPVLNGWPRTW